MQKNKSIIQLIYFNFPFWRVDICKLTLAIGGVSYEEKIISKKYFILNKEKKEFPFGQVPVLKVGDDIIAQTSAMVRYCGKLSKLYSSDVMVCAKIDQVIDFANDVTNLLIPSIRETDVRKRKVLRQELNIRILPKWLGYLNRFLKNNKTSNFFLTENFTIADIIVWRILLWLTSGKLENINLSFKNEFQDLEKYFQFISQQEILTSTKEYEFIINNQHII